MPLIVIVYFIVEMVARDQQKDIIADVGAALAEALCTVKFRVAVFMASWYSFLRLFATSFFAVVFFTLFLAAFFPADSFLYLLDVGILAHQYL